MNTMRLSETFWGNAVQLMQYAKLNFGKNWTSWWDAELKIHAKWMPTDEREQRYVKVLACWAFHHRQACLAYLQQRAYAILKSDGVQVVALDSEIWKRSHEFWREHMQPSQARKLTNYFVVSASAVPDIRKLVNITKGAIITSEDVALQGRSVSFAFDTEEIRRYVLTEVQKIVAAHPRYLGAPDD